MSPTPRVLTALAIALVWTACASIGYPSDPLSDTELQGLTYSGVAPHEVALRGGVWQGEPFVPGGASRQRVDLVRDFRRDGDLSDNPQPETIVILAENSGGSGVVSYLAVVGFRNGAWRNIGTARIGDRVQLRDARIRERRIELDVVQAGPSDAACCPSQLATRVFALESVGSGERDGSAEGVESGGRDEPEALREIDRIEAGTLSLAVLEGGEWRLSHFAHSRPAPATPAITLSVDGLRISGSSGCNRYFAALEPGDAPGELSIGPVAGSRMACPDDVMALESRYLAALQTVTGYGFLNGRLALRWQEDGQPEWLLYDRVPAAAPGTAATSSGS